MIDLPAETQERIKNAKPYEPLEIAREAIELVLSRVSGQDRVEEARIVFNLALQMSSRYGLRLNQMDQ